MRVWKIILAIFVMNEISTMRSFNEKQLRYRTVPEEMRLQSTLVSKGARESLFVAGPSHCRCKPAL